jgi:hypothetical protein
LAVKRGDFTARLPDDWTGVAGKIADTFNDVIATNQRMTRELERMVLWWESRAGSRNAPRSGTFPIRGPMRSDRLNDLIERSGATDERNGAVYRGGAQGRSVADDGNRDRGSAAGGEFLHTAKVVNTMVISSGVSPRK